MNKTVSLNKVCAGDIKLIVAKVNAKSISSFLEDLFVHWINKSTSGEFIIDLLPIIKQKQEDLIDVGLSISADILYQLRILAAETEGTSLKAYMEAIITWLVEEHRVNGRVWIDDTPVNVLPIRTRK